MSDNNGTAKGSIGRRAALLTAFALTLIVLVYAPLVASRIENKLFKTQKVAQTCKAIGVLDTLEFIYQNTPWLGR